MKIDITMSSFQDINSLTQNQANTFEFTAEEAERILLKSTDMSNVLSSEDERIKLEKLKQKKIRLLMHGTTLSEYWKSKKIPRGLRIQKVPTTGKNSEPFVKKWSEILNKCSLDLMLLVIDTVTEEAEQVKSEILQQEEMMRKKFGDAFLEIEQTVLEITKKYQENLQVTKLKKYKRDTEGYKNNQVYKWDVGYQQNDEQRPRRTPVSSSTQSTAARKTRHNWRGATREETEDYLQDTDSTYSSRDSSSSAFLSRQHPRRRRRRRNADGEGAPSGPRQRPWTRSYTRTR